MEEKSKKHDTSLLLKIVALAMIFHGIFYIFVGLPFLLIAIGVVPLVIGVVSLYYGVQIWQLKKSAYNGAIIITGLALLSDLYMHHYMTAIIPALVMYLIYYSKDKFVN